MTPPAWFLLAFVLVGCASEPEAEIVPVIHDVPGMTPDISYGPSPAQALDLFVPAGQKGESLVVFVHGGAWKGGSRIQYREIANEMRSQGIAAATVDYRFSPGVRHPAHAEDVANALGWLADNAAKYGYDPKRTFLVGHSAGGHIAASIATDPRLLALAKNPPAGYVGLEGIYDIPNLAKRWPGYPKWFLNDAFGNDPKAWPAASPTRAKVASKAPWLLVHSKGDELVDMEQTADFAAHLEAAGVRVDILHPVDESHDEVVQRLATPGDPVAKAIVAFVKRA